jgi:hypothetical protein
VSAAEWAVRAACRNLRIQAAVAMNAAGASRSPGITAAIAIGTEAEVNPEAGGLTVMGWRTPQDRAAAITMSMTVRELGDHELHKSHGGRAAHQPGNSFR